MTQSDEIWVDIDGYKGRYQVSNMGRIKSVSGKGKGRSKNDFIRKLQIDSWGYPRIKLNKNKKYKMFRVHRLVAIAFIDNPYNKPEINHINGDKKDNRPENLEWVTGKENIRHAFDNGLNRGHQSDKWGKLHFASKSGKAISPSGQVFFFDSEREFCRLQGFNQAQFNRMMNGKVATCKGWRRFEGELQ